MGGWGPDDGWYFVNHCWRKFSSIVPMTTLEIHTKAPISHFFDNLQGLLQEVCCQSLIRENTPRLNLPAMTKWLRGTGTYTGGWEDRYNRLNPPPSPGPSRTHLIVHSDLCPTWVGVYSTPDEGFCFVYFLVLVSYIVIYVAGFAGHRFAVNFKTYTFILYFIIFLYILFYNYLQWRF